MAAGAGASGVRGRIEAWFATAARFIYRHHRLTITLVLLLSALSIAQLHRIQVDPSAEGFLEPDDPVLVTYDDFRARFGRDDLVVVAVQPPEVFDRGFLAALRSFHEDLARNVPHLDEITSLVNARSTRAEGDRLISEELGVAWPQTPGELPAFERRVREDPNYRNLLISGDGRTTTILLKLDTHSAPPKDTDPLLGFEATERSQPAPVDRPQYLTNDANDRAVAAIREIAGRHDAPEFQVFLVGAPVLQYRIGSSIVQDLTFFLGLAVLVCIVFLFVLFRTLTGVLLPVCVVLLSLLTTLGLMPVLGMPIQLTTQMLPALLMAVGTSDSVHILAIFYQQIREGQSREEALASAMRHSGLAVLLTSVSTAGAFLSFTAGDLAPVWNLGALAPIGVMLAFAYSVTLLPALLSVAPLPRRDPRQRRLSAWLDTVLDAAGTLGARHPWAVIAGFSLVLAIAVLGASMLRFSHEPLRWFNERDELRRAYELANRQLEGVMTLEVLIDTEERDGLHDPELLRRMDQVAAFNQGLRRGDLRIGKTWSIVDIVKEVNQTLNEGSPAAYAVPPDRALVAQELLVFEGSGSDALDTVADAERRVGRMTLKVPWVDAIVFPAFIAELEQDYRRIIGTDAQITITGKLSLMARTFTALVSSLAKSYVVALLAIVPLMMLLLGSVGRGLVAMIPNLIPIVVTLGVMGLLDIPLDAFTLLVGSIAIGLAVDDTIHFMHNFQRYYAIEGDPTLAVQRTLRTTGQALLFTTLVLCGGMLVFAFGSMRAVSNFGFLTGFALFTAFVTDVLLAPALMVLLHRLRSRRVRVSLEEGLSRWG